MREIPLREVADVTKISLRYLEALEQDRFDVLPAPVFAKGFLREYSRYVGLDVDEVVNSFLIATGEAVAASETEEVETSESPPRSKISISAVLAVAAIITVVVVVALLGRLRESQPVESSPIAAPIPLPKEPAPVPQPEAGEIAVVPLTVIIDFTEDCWMEAVVDDDRTISELRVQGESMRLEAEESVLLTLGNPGGVRVEVNGRPYDFSFPQNRIVRNLEIDLALARELAEPEAQEPSVGEGQNPDDGEGQDSGGE
jgi:cytoskeletal protein RodZ